MTATWIESRAVVTDGAGSIRVETTQLAPPRPGEVLVRLEASGICHTDADSMWWGRELVIGHEGAGTIEAVGDGVGLPVGTRVVLNWASPCGSCFHCAAGRQHLCERRDLRDTKRERTAIGDRPVSRSFALGTLSEWTVVDQAACVAIGEDVSTTHACIVGCCVMTGYGSVANVARVVPGSTVVVLGVGAVGLNIVQSSVIAGAERVIAIDIDPNRLETASHFGATHVLQPDGTDLSSTIERVASLTDARGADYAFECTGVAAFADAPLRLVRDAGTAVQVSGFEEEAVFDLRAFEWDKIYINPLYGQCRPQLDIPAIFRHHAAGRLRFDELIATGFGLEDVGRAIAAMAARSIIKPVVHPWADRRPNHQQENEPWQA